MVLDREKALFRRSARARGEPRRVNRLIDLASDAIQTLTLTATRIDRITARQPKRKVLLLGIYGEGRFVRELVDQAAHSRQTVHVALGALRARDEQLCEETVADGLDDFKFPNLNEVVATIGTEMVASSHWTIVFDDDIEVPARFLDRFIAVLEHFDLTIGQPALTRMSYGAWQVTRRRPFSILRETRFAEPQLIAFRQEAATDLIPFSDAYGGWGLDLHWAAIAARRGWRIGIVDAVPVRHESRPYGSQYSADMAGRQVKRSAAERPSLPPERAEDVVRIHRTLRRPN